MQEAPIVIHRRKLDDAQHRRVNFDHKASVVVEDGQFKFLTEEIITPKGLTKTNTRVSIQPKPEERVVSLREATYLFGELQHLNIILTNACNLSCTYCYEQHNKDFGRFTEESLLEAYDFLLNISNHERKTFQFFGGEPLIHKDLILSFCEKNKDYLSVNAHGPQQQVVSLITNGVLLSPDFLAKYFSYDFTWMMVSLDTIRSELDHRELKPGQITKILESIAAVPDHAKERVCGRCTISRETAPHMIEYVDKMYEIGVRSIIIHPLVLDSQNGFIKWEQSEWDALHRDILAVMDKYPDMSISFSEGVGKKGENNCMIGADMLAIDASGDFSGCYFFTNQKANGADIAILGNLYNDTIYIDRYQSFQKTYIETLESEEQCQTCNYKNACYQCPAGNLDTGSGRMFRPDDMCQNIVKLYLDLQNDVMRRQYKKKIEDVMTAIANEGEDYVFSKTILHLMYRMFSGKHPSVEEKQNTSAIKPEELYAAWSKMVVDKAKPNTTSYMDFVQSIPVNCSNSIDIKALYEHLATRSQVPITKSQEVRELDIGVRAGYLALLHVLVLGQNSFDDESFVQKMLAA